MTTANRQKRQNQSSSEHDPIARKTWFTNWGRPRAAYFEFSNKQSKPYARPHLLGSNTHSLNVPLFQTESLLPSLRTSPTFEIGSPRCYSPVHVRVLRVERPQNRQQHVASDQWCREGAGDRRIAAVPSAIHQRPRAGIAQQVPPREERLENAVAHSPGDDILRRVGPRGEGWDDGVARGGALGESRAELGFGGRALVAGNVAEVGDAHAVGQDEVCEVAEGLELGLCRRVTGELRSFRVFTKSVKV